MKFSILLASIFIPVSLVRADAVFVTTFGNDVVSRVSAAGVASPVIVAGLANPAGIVFDSAGNAFVANTATGASDGTVVKFPAGGGAPVTMASGLGNPAGLALDASGNVYAALRGENRVIKITAPGVFATFGTLPGGSSPQGIAFSPAGDLFVANQGGNTISKITAAGAVSQFSNDVTSPAGVAFDPGGTLYAIHGGASGAIVRFNPGGKAQNFVSGFSNPRAIAIDSAGLFFVVNGDSSIRKVDGSKAITSYAAGLADPQGIALRAPRMRLLAVKNGQAGDPAGAAFSALYAPASGDGAAYRGKLLAGVAGVSSANATGIWHSDDSGARRLVARQQTGFAPDTMGAMFNSFTEPVANGAGEVAFRAALKAGAGDATTANANGVWAESGPGSLRLVARQGAQPPGVMETAKFGTFSALAMPETNGPVFVAKISGATVTGATNQGIWRGGGGAAALVLRKGDVLANVSGTPRVASFTFGVPAPFSTGHGRGVAGDGTVSVLAKLSDTRSAILTAVPGSTALVAATGEILAGPLAGAKIAKLFSPAIGGDLGVAFRAGLTPGVGGVVSGNSAALFHRASGGASTLVARATFPAPGTAGAVFGAFADPLTDANGKVAFRATLKGGIGDAAAGTTAGVWYGPAAGVALVARQGAQAPGFRQSVKFTAFSNLALADDIGPVFLGSVAGSGITTANNQGLWAVDADGTLQLVAQKGATYDFGGTKKTVTSINVFKAFPVVAGHSRSVEKDGGISLLANFSDGTHGVIRVNLP